MALDDDIDEVGEEELFNGMAKAKIENETDLFKYGILAAVQLAFGIGILMTKLIEYGAADYVVKLASNYIHFEWYVPH